MSEVHGNYRGMCHIGNETVYIIGVPLGRRQVLLSKGHEVVIRPADEDARTPDDVPVPLLERLQQAVFACEQATLGGALPDREIERELLAAARAVVDAPVDAAPKPQDAEVIERAREALNRTDDHAGYKSGGHYKSATVDLRNAVRDLLAAVEADERLTREEWRREFDRLWVQAERGNRAPMKLTRERNGYVLGAFDDSIQNIPEPNPLDVLGAAATPAKPDPDEMSKEECHAEINAVDDAIIGRRTGCNGGGQLALIVDEELVGMWSYADDEEWALQQAVHALRAHQEREE